MANEKEMKQEISTLKGNVSGMRKDMEKMEKENKVLKADQEQNKGMGEALKVANEKVKTLSGQNETLAKKVGAITGDFPKISGFQSSTPVGEVRLDEKTVVNMYHVAIKLGEPMILHVTSKDGKGESAFLTSRK